MSYLDRKFDYTHDVKKAYKNYELNLCKLEDILLSERSSVFRAPREDEHVIVLLSGGLDSVIMTGILLNKFKCKVHPIYIKRGAKAQSLEEKSFDYFVEFYKKIHKDKVGKPYKFETGIPPKEFKKNFDRAMIDTVGHPLRNSTMQNYAVMYAISLGKQIGEKINTVFVGSVGEDYKEPESGLLSLRAKTISTCTSLGDWDFQITSPMLEKELKWDWKITRTGDRLLYKPDLIFYAEKIHPVRIPHEKSRSCFSAKETSCKECSACKKRYEAISYAKEFLKGGEKL